MSKYVEPVINLQITVPHIVLPSGSQHQQHAEGVAAGDQQRYTEQVRILLLNALSSQHDERTGEVLPLTMEKGRYRIFQIKIFQIKDISAQGHALLLQILRIYPAVRQQGWGSSSREIRQVEQLRLSDALAFTVEFRRSSDASELVTLLQGHLA